MAFIYIITNIDNGKVYIGQTLRDVKSRWNGHLSQARNGGRRYINCAIRHHGQEAFTCEEIEEVPDYGIDDREKFLISFYRSNEKTFGYNLAEGGRNGRLNAETCAAISQRMIGNKHSVGAIRSDEFKRAVGERTRNSIPGALEKKWSQETKDKMSIAGRGRKISQEQKDKQSASMKGRKLTEETKLKISKSRLGTKRSSETKAKMAETRRLWWAERKRNNPD